MLLVHAYRLPDQRCRLQTPCALSGTCSSFSHQRTRPIPSDLWFSSYPRSVALQVLCRCMQNRIWFARRKKRLYVLLPARSKYASKMADEFTSRRSEGYFWHPYECALSISFLMILKLRVRRSCGNWSHLPGHEFIRICLISAKFQTSYDQHVSTASSSSRLEAENDRIQQLKAQVLSFGMSENSDDVHVTSWYMHDNCICVLLVPIFDNIYCIYYLHLWKMHDNCICVFLVSIFDNTIFYRFCFVCDDKWNGELRIDYSCINFSKRLVGSAGTRPGP